ncbi:MAG TPA: 16S rRNA (adenine(1518)-N(6)/adenine(1519)-N(6))-dimethyltransferase RsmA [bacterium]|nr:16S rRNA (adenine(1518)-N(6)/adenine(1519)-N(6))-dimethyltransferase RsmA [bacterium]HNT64203.1 16S rRNA (adenine(1518)-N(6)/adenine(1519)-N(6))-dimethyltransferase RsmA [bacterium]HOX85193.1 16S rRNA (adenine(1518)-N(6)/adenine(1519)-N(6))-dimethyltransferase RsmA [bacterium]HPG44352.1 16S rRNA (adenine(1518)-N(6)/adenine(1519)-N(6))-dimethyltransferase RsmA [bacterium]HPM96910.1 16S rRNA (adenine(1518)-N(6)/adenine(1519)-N(6))-dimethyltransferase RsmA [bacterium]
MKPTGLRAKQSLGQNFLIDPNTARKIVECLGLQSVDYAIEIGAGTGTLTETVAQQVAHLHAVEIDQRCVTRLQEHFGNDPRVTVVHADFLHYEWPELPPGQRWRIFGNIPYHITSPILFRVLERRALVQELTLLIQKEVAQRIVAKCSSKAYGILSVISQTFADVDILMRVPHTVFRPQPKIESALVRWQFTDRREKQLLDVEMFRFLVRTAFNQRRKMLRKSLKNVMLNADFSDQQMQRRPEELSIQEWIDFVNRAIQQNFLTMPKVVPDDPRSELNSTV